MWHENPQTGGAPGTGDMLKSVYDVDTDGIVDDAEGLDSGAGHTMSAQVVVEKLSFLEGVGNPNGKVTGRQGQTYRDTNNGILYRCVSAPTGTVWSVV
jgi:hypothetical protein